jgi:hypothetical protein
MARELSTLERSPVAQRYSTPLTRKQPATRPAGLRLEAEDLLRELAFVYRATQAVRTAMSAVPSAC